MTQPNSRRDFLANVVLLPAVIPGVGIAAGHGFRFLMPSRDRRTEEVLVGDLGGLPPGTSRVLKGVHGNDLIAVRLADGQVKVFSSICTHLGCHVRWDPVAGNFLCPCHMARFDSSGQVIAGPAPTALPSFPTKVVGDKNFVVVPVREE